MIPISRSHLVNIEAGRRPLTQILLARFADVYNVRQAAIVPPGYFAHVDETKDGGERLTTRDEAIAAMGEVLAEAEHALYFEGTVAEAARRAYTPTGPSIDELERRITELRRARNSDGEAN